MRWTLTWKPVAFLMVLGLTATLAACNGGGGDDVMEPIEEPPAVEEPAEEAEEEEAEEEEGAE